MGAEGGHNQNARGIPLSVSKKDYGDDGSVYDEQGVGFTPGGGSSGYRWDMANQGVYTAKVGHLSGAGGLPDHI